MGVIARATDAGDHELVGMVRAGDDSAFEELYRRYSRRVAGYVCRMVGDPDRAEDVTQEAFFSALRRLRQTDTSIIFKPWIFEIAKNAAIDHFRRTSRAEEVSLFAQDALRPADRLRLVGGGPAPDAVYEGKERLDQLRSAFDELSASHSRILVLRELEGLSYREIGQRMELSRPAVESTLFRARRRLNEEYAELDTGARCIAITAAIARLAEGIDSTRDRRRVARHARRCSACRRHARELGVFAGGSPRSRVAAIVPLPGLLRRRRADGSEAVGGAAGQGYATSVQQVAGTWGPAVVGAGGAEGAAQAWSKAVAIVAAIALAGGGAAVQERVLSPDRGAPSQAAPTGSGQGDSTNVPGAPAGGERPGTGAPGDAGTGPPLGGDGGATVEGDRLNGPTLQGGPRFTTPDAPSLSPPATSPPELPGARLPDAGDPSLPGFPDVPQPPADPGSSSGFFPVEPPSLGTPPPLNLGVALPQPGVEVPVPPALPTS